MVLWCPTSQRADWAYERKCEVGQEKGILGGSTTNDGVQEVHQVRSRKINKKGAQRISPMPLAVGMQKRVIQKRHGKFATGARLDMGAFINRGTPKSSTLIGFSHFGTPISKASISINHQLGMTPLVL